MRYCFSSLLIIDENDINHVHPADREVVISKFKSGWQRRCFEYLGQHDDYDVLKDGNLRIRVMNAFIEEVPEPKLKVDEVVYVKRRDKNGSIIRIHWHLNKAKPIYAISINDEESGYQYFDEHLDKII